MANKDWSTTAIEDCVKECSLVETQILAEVQLKELKLKAKSNVALKAYVAQLEAIVYDATNGGGIFSKNQQVIIDKVIKKEFYK